MSQKKIKQEPMANAPPGVPKELSEIPATFALARTRGDENYSLGLRLLLDRFATSAYTRAGKTPEQLVLESVHSLINVLTEVFPPNKDGRPLTGPEVATLFGAVIGTVAAEGYVHGRLSLAEVEAQVEVFWIAMREWLARGYAGIKYMETSGAAARSKLVIPGKN